MLLPRLALLSLAAPIAASPQWPSTPAQDLLLSDGAGEEVQVKLSPSTDGHTFASWYDSDPGGSPAFGYDVRLQRLGPSGLESWPAGGILIADRGFSSVQDYGLDAGPNDDAFLAFRDDRFSGVQVTATRVDASGNQLWGPTGVQVSNTTDFVASPRIAGTSDGQAVVAWSSGSNMRLQRLDAGGAPLWGQGLTVPAPPGGAVLSSFVDADDMGGAIVAWVRQPSGFLGPKHLYAQKLNAAGVPQWNNTGIPIFTSDSLQFGNFPTFSHDGFGGGIFAWYGTGSLQCYAQHVLANGTLAFGANGVALSTNSANLRVSPSAAFDPATGETYAFWTELNSSQSQRGVGGQKLDASGNRLWGPSGISVLPLGSDDISFVKTVKVDSGAAVLWFQSPSFGQDQVRAVHVDPQGSALHSITPVASTASQMDDLVAVRGPLGDVFAAWHGDAGGDYDALAKNLRADGGVGPQAGALPRNAGANPNSLAVDIGPLGGTLNATIDLSASVHPVAVLLAYLAPSNSPYGNGVILVDIFHPAGELLHLPPDFGPIATFSRTIPNIPVLAGLALHAQGVHAAGPGPIELTNAQDIYLGL